MSYEGFFSEKGNPWAVIFFFVRFSQVFIFRDVQVSYFFLSVSKITIRTALSSLEIVPTVSFEFHSPLLAISCSPRTLHWLGFCVSLRVQQCLQLYCRHCRQCLPWQLYLHLLFFFLVSFPVAHVSLPSLADAFLTITVVWLEACTMDVTICSCLQSSAYPFKQCRYMFAVWQLLTQ